MKKFSTKDGREIVIRTATEDDASMFLDFSKHIFERFDSFNSSSIEEFKNDLEVERQFIASHQSDNRVLLVAIHNDKIVGACDFTNRKPIKLRHWGNFGLSVREEFHRNGIAKALLTELFNWALENKTIEMIGLYVHADNHRAIKLYETIGFKQYGVIPSSLRYKNGNYIDTIEMYIYLRDLKKG